MALTLNKHLLGNAKTGVLRWEAADTKSIAFRQLLGVRLYQMDFSSSSALPVKQ